MRKLILTILTVSMSACAGSKPAPKQPLSNEGTQEGAAGDAHAVDWMNRTYGQYTVVNGEYAWDNGDDDRGFFNVSAPVYGDLTGDGIDEAIIVTVENGGGTGMFDGAEIYAVRGGQPVVIGSIPGGDRGDGGLDSVYVEAGKLIVRRMDSQDGDGACCPSQVRVETWAWNGHDFAQDEAAARVEPFGDED